MNIAEKISNEIDAQRVNDMFYKTELYDTARKQAIKQFGYAFLSSYGDAYIFKDGSVLEVMYTHDDCSLGEGVYESEDRWKNTIRPEERRLWGLDE